MELSTEDLEAMPLGSKLYDCDGDELTRVEGGWRYTFAIRNHPHYGDYVATSMETAREFTPLSLHRRMKADDLYEFRDLYLKMTEEEQQAVTEIVDAARHRLNK